VTPIFPANFTAGTTFDQLTTLTAYPATAGWSLVVLLRGPGAYNLAATPEGAQHRLTVAASATAAWAPGRYTYTVRAIRAGFVVAVDVGQIEILPDPAAQSAGVDIRSHAQIVLDNIEAVLEKRATQDQQRYTINNRELWRTPIADLLLLRDRYAAIVAKERRKARGQSLFGQSVRIRFTDTR
jgi:hypothetical protein